MSVCYSEREARRDKAIYKEILRRTAHFKVARAVAGVGLDHAVVVIPTGHDDELTGFDVGVSLRSPGDRPNSLKGVRLAERRALRVRRRHGKPPRRFTDLLSFHVPVTTAVKGILVPLEADFAADIVLDAILHGVWLPDTMVMAPNVAKRLDDLSNMIRQALLRSLRIQ